MKPVNSNFLFNWLMKRTSSVHTAKNAYSIIVHGKNVSLNLADLGRNENAKCGFYTTRVILSDDIDKAEQEAIDMVKKEIAKIMLNEEGDLPQFEIYEVALIPMPKQYKPGRGFTFYPAETEGT